MTSKDKNGLEYQEEIIAGKKREVLVRRDESLGYQKTESKAWLKPNYDDWLKLPAWELNEAIFLLYDQQPKEPDCPRDENGDETTDEKTIIGFSGDMKNTLIMAQRSIVAGELSLLDEKHVEPHDFIKWADSKELPVPVELKYLLETKKKKVVPRKKQNEYFDSLISKTYKALAEMNDKVTAFQVLNNLNEYDVENIGVEWTYDEKENVEKLEYKDSISGKTKKISFKRFQNKLSELKKNLLNS